MSVTDDRYVEITTHLRSAQSFCDFLSKGGTVRVAQSDGGAFKDVTAELLLRQQNEVQRLKQVRRTLFPDRAEEDFQPGLYSHH
ncbi:hypothetical protein [Rhizobium sp. OAE497]|uniref:hypothetical protein n=1 Tax=Rhizobium sp. OAE497 TaxID=2663796 RepID=UPI000DD56416